MCIVIMGGGCNGLSYKMCFIGEMKKGDILVCMGGVSVLVDVKMVFYLKGMVFDYLNKMVGGGFKFFNFNVKVSCLCGESFSV